MHRRKFLKAGIGGTALGTLGAITVISSDADAKPSGPTPSEIKGPFYPVVAQKDKDFDLTQVEGRKEKAEGRVIVIQGQVLDTTGTPIEDATVDLWQANTHGRYRHPHDPSETPLDPNFQGWAIVPSGKDGSFRFKTIFPGTYAAAENWMRPPHIHFKVSKRGYTELITQMYFPGNKLNDVDLLIKRKSKAEAQRMIASAKHDEPNTYLYKIVLERL